MDTVITTNSQGQPGARFDQDTGWVRVEFAGSVKFLSAAMAEEFSGALEWAAKMARGEA